LTLLVFANKLSLLFAEDSAMVHLSLSFRKISKIKIHYYINNII